MGATGGMDGPHASWTVTLGSADANPPSQRTATKSNTNPRSTNHGRCMNTLPYDPRTRFPSRHVWHEANGRECFYFGEPSHNREAKSAAISGTAVPKGMINRMMPC